METYSDYKGYGIKYSSMSGTTKVVQYGFIFRVFTGLGEEKGLLLAKSYIDNICRNVAP